MAAIYKEKNGEVHVYLNRTPKKDGREPLLGWMIAATALLGIRLAFILLIVLPVLFAPGYSDFILAEMKNTPGVFILDGLALIFLAAYIGSKFRKLVFSEKDGAVYSALLFFRRRIAGFEDFEDIRVGDQEMLGRKWYSYQLIRRGDKLRKPLLLSPKVKNFNRLARYYHTVVPLLRDVMRLPEESAAEPAEAAVNDAEAVAVELCEVPTEEAEGLVTAREKPAEKKTRSAVVSGKLECFVKKNGLYRSLLTTAQILMILFILLMLAALVVPLVVFDGMPLPISLILLSGLGLYLYFLSRESLFIRLDPRRRTITAVTCFGLRKREFTLGQMEKLTLKHIGPIKALCVVLEGMKVDPNVIESVSIRKVRTAMREFGEILGIDAARLLDV